MSGNELRCGLRVLGSLWEKVNRLYFWCREDLLAAASDSLILGLFALADDDGTDQNGTPEDVSPNPEDANSGSGPGAFRMLDMPIEG